MSHVSRMEQFHQGLALRREMMPGFAEQAFNERLGRGHKEGFLTLKVDLFKAMGGEALFQFLPNDMAGNIDFAR